MTKSGLDKEEILDSNELCPKDHDYMNHYMVIHTVLMLIFHIITLALSIGAVVVTVVLLTHGTVGVNINPNEELNVYWKDPNDQDHHLTNI